MNVDTGELRRGLTEAQAKELGLKEVPEHLKKYADKELGYKDKVMVDMSKRTPLTQWAKSIRKNKKVKRKMSEASRRINRKH